MSNEDCNIRIVGERARGEDHLISLCAAFASALKRQTQRSLDSVRKTMHGTVLNLSKQVEFSCRYQGSHSFPTSERLHKV